MLRYLARLLSGIKTSNIQQSTVKKNEIFLLNPNLKMKRND